MVMEVCCGQCNGRLLIETAGVVVACPHCGVHLSIPLPDSETDPHAESAPANPEYEHSALSTTAPNSAESHSHAITGELTYPAEMNVPPAIADVPSPDLANMVSASSIFHTSDIDATEPNRMSDVGWPSSPNLSLADPPDQIAPFEPLGAPREPAETASAAPDFSWMASTEKSVTPSSPSEPPQFSFGASPSTEVSTDSPVSEQIGWPASPNLSTSETTETQPVQDAMPVSTIPTVPLAAPEVVPNVVSPPTINLAPASGAPDFSWLQSSTSPPAVASPPQFSFGAPSVASEAAEHSIPGGGFAPPAAAFSGSFTPPSVTSPVAAQPPLLNSAVPNVFDPASNPPVAFGAADPSVGPWGEPSTSSPSSAFALDPSQAQAPASGFNLSSFGAATTSSQSTESDQPAASQSHATTPIAAELGREQAASGQPLVSMALLILGSYASLVTICLLYMLIFMRKHQLESLPDLKTVQQLGGRASIPRPEHLLPAGHELKLGQSERFGNIRITVLRVTREPLEFKHFSGDSSQTRSPSEPVLKLWLKFENVSMAQSIAPLDTTLMFFNRAVEAHVASYNVIFREQDRKQRKAQFYYPFDRMSAESEWTMVGQHTNESLAPGESFETYIPSEENTEGLKGDVIWRVHFRKGHGFMTGNGVTTLIDVRFNTDDIKAESA